LKWVENYDALAIFPELRKKRPKKCSDREGFWRLLPDREALKGNHLLFRSGSMPDY
jgi:hypothetical protein